MKCEPDCPVAQWKRGMDPETILRYNWSRGGYAIIYGDPPYLATSIGDGKCELHGDREGCEGSGNMYLWKGQDPFTLRQIEKNVCVTCFFQLELIRNGIESIDGY